MTLVRTLLLVGSTICLAQSGFAQITGVPNGKPQTLRPHVPTRAAPASQLAPVQAMFGVTPTTARAYGGTPIDVTQYHYDISRTGWNPTETDLTPATVKSGKFGLLASLSVDGNVFAQPLLVNAVKLGDGTTHDVLLIVTGNNSIYAFDAHSYAQLWKINLGNKQLTVDTGCSDVQQGYGISATPVIVRSGSAATMYLANAIEPSS